MRSPTPLQVAGAAALLLLVVVGADVAMHRTYALDVREDGEWRTVGTTGQDWYSGRPEAVLEVAPGDEVTFRLRLDNDYPWNHESRFTVRANAGVVANGTVEAESWGQASREFSVMGEDLVAAFPDPAPPTARKEGFSSIEVEIHGETILYAGIHVREATA